MKKSSVTLILLLFATITASAQIYSNQPIDHDKVYTATYDSLVNDLVIDGLEGIGFRIARTGDEEILAIGRISTQEAHLVLPSGKIKFRITKKYILSFDEGHFLRPVLVDTDEYHEAVINRVAGGGDYGYDMPAYRLAALVNSGVESITIPGNYTSVKYVAYNCGRLKNVYIEDGVRAIGCNLPNEEYAGEGCPDSESTFSRCGKLEELYLPASVEKIRNLSNYYYESPRYNAPGFRYIHVNPNNKRYKDIDGIVYSKNGDTLMYVPSAISSIDIPEGVVATDPNNYYLFDRSLIFKYNYYNHISVPSTMKEIYSQTFPDTVYFHSKTPNQSYGHIRGKKIIYIPRGCMIPYRELYELRYQGQSSEFISSVISLLTEMDETSITPPLKDNSQGEPLEFYSPLGIKTSKPAKGINIMRMKDGSVRKSLVR
ncbi:MAG: leucine-rich repeat domain-containing protein [Bacteroidaceae bacterium]|nr:leucine-rich repeat domain-containing protein [Bacteroidaceae bacterium]